MASAKVKGGRREVMPVDDRFGCRGALASWQGNVGGGVYGVGEPVASQCAGKAQRCQGRLDGDGKQIEVCRFGVSLAVQSAGEGFDAADFTQAVQGVFAQAGVACLSVGEHPRSADERDRHLLVSERDHIMLSPLALLRKGG